MNIDKSIYIYKYIIYMKCVYIIYYVVTLTKGAHGNEGRVRSEK